MITYNNTRAIQNKWPGMIVRGDTVSSEQAAEILIRTDYHFPFFGHSCNDRVFMNALNDLFEIPTDDDAAWDWDSRNALRERYKILDLDYIDNFRIASAWVGGAHGWCDWNGTIASDNCNIGKWPSVEEVAEDWDKIAQAFPFLNLECQLFSGETCEEDAVPLLKFIVKDGNVTVEDSDDAIGTFTDFDYFTRSERGISVSELREKIVQVYGEVFTWNSKD